MDDASRKRERPAASATRDRSSAGFLLPISMHTAALGDEEITIEAKLAKSWVHARVPFRKAIVMATYAAIGSTCACLALLGARGDLHVTKEMPRSGSKPQIQVVAIDAPWTPLPLDAKPWTPAPYTPTRSGAQ